jgi:hypothetical protein
MTLLKKTNGILDRKNTSHQGNELLVGLSKLGNEEHLRVVATSLAARRVDHQNAWAKRRGYKLSSGHPCIQKLLHKRCQHNRTCSPPGVDHPSMWIWGRRPIFYIFQPYYLEGDTVIELAKFCMEHELEFSITAESSWHFPGLTTTVEINRKADRKQINDISAAVHGSLREN